VRETGRANRVTVLSRDKTDVSRGGGISIILPSSAYEVMFYLSVCLSVSNFM